MSSRLEVGPGRYHGEQTISGWGRGSQPEMAGMVWGPPHGSATLAQVECGPTVSSWWRSKTTGSGTSQWSVPSLIRSTLILDVRCLDSGSSTKLGDLIKFLCTQRPGFLVCQWGETAHCSIVERIKGQTGCKVPSLKGAPSSPPPPAQIGSALGWVIQPAAPPLWYHASL